MIALDTNILIYAHRLDSEWNKRAYPCLVQLAQGRHAWAIPWPCIHEFLAVVTHPRVFPKPTPMEVALDEVSAWLESPSLVVLSEQGQYWDNLSAILRSGRIVGPLIHDAKIAALCAVNGVTELWSADRDFGRFPGLTVRNPLIG